MTPAARIAQLLQDAPRTAPTPRQLDALAESCRGALGQRQHVLVRYDADQGLHVADYYDGTGWVVIWQRSLVVVELHPVRPTATDRLAQVRERHQQLQLAMGRGRR